MNIVEMQLSELKPYDNNPRHNDVAVQPVANSIREFGFKVPIVVDAGNVIIAGHTRYRAAQQLGLDTVPCIVADDLSPQQVKAFRLADNKVSEFATWDPDAMMEELQGILEIDMSEFGFLDNTDALEEVDDTYTTDINIPQYEPSGDVVPLESCIDDSKTEALLMEIEDSNLSDTEKDFLRKAAQRHNQFNYKRIAEYYANASAEMQDLMERSALVIIDYDDAIKNGYVQLSSSLEEILGDENHVTRVKIHNNQAGDDTTLDTDGVFVYVGNVPNSQIFNNLNITDQAGWIITNDQMETTIPGIYAIGDVRQKQLRQITTAVGDGGIAGQNAFEYVEAIKHRQTVKD